MDGIALIRFAPSRKPPNPAVPRRDDPRRSRDLQAARSSSGNA
jgi:hypothetical protein